MTSDDAPTRGLPGTAGEAADPAERDPDGTDAAPDKPRDGHDEHELGMDRLDPHSVYLAGTLQEGNCARGSIAKVETPNLAVVGFECHARPGNIDPLTGHPLYWNGSTGELREFRCDNDCKYWSQDTAYPVDPESNDPLVPLDHCEGGQQASEVLWAPDGSRLYHCEGDTWYDDEYGAMAYTGHIDTLGPNLTALVHGALIDLRTREQIGGYLHVDALSVTRATDSGFLAATLVPAIVDETIELWQVTLDGVATRLGAYPPLPENQFAHGSIVLDASGALYQICSVDQSGTDTVVRRTVEGESRQVYSEADDPIVKLHGDYLITGP